jgi:hypothetical protein
MNPTPENPTPPSPISAKDPISAIAPQVPKEPLSSIGEILESLLKSPRRLTHAIGLDPASVIGKLILSTVAAMVIFGLLLASYSGGLHFVMVPLKITGGMFLSCLICLPSFYIFNALNGSLLSLKSTVALVASITTMLGLMLVALGPVIWLFTQASDSLSFIAGLAIAFWVLGVAVASRFVGSQSRDFGLRSQSSLTLWFLIFLSVTFQMATNLRPLLGKSDSHLPTTKRFFVEHWFAPEHWNDRSKSGSSEGIVPPDGRDR